LYRVQLVYRKLGCSAIFLSGMVFVKSMNRVLDKPIVLVGMMGSGKTTLGNAMAKKWGVPFFDVDAVIEHRFGKTVAEIFATEGEAFFRQAECDAIQQLLEHKSAIIALGGGAFLAERNRDAIKNKALSVFLNVSDEILFRRLEKRAAHRPLLQGGQGSLRERIRVLLTERAPFYVLADVTIGFDKRQSLKRAVEFFEESIEGKI